MEYSLPGDLLERAIESACLYPIISPVTLVEVWWSWFPDLVLLEVMLLSSTPYGMGKRLIAFDGRDSELLAVAALRIPLN